MQAPDRLEDLIATLEKEGDLVRISQQVDPNLEITEIADRCVKNGGPALIFENPKGSDIPLAINLFASERRMALALGVEDLAEIADRITDVIKPEIPTGFMDKLAMLPKLKEIATAGPKYVKRAACQEIVLEGDDVDLTKLPVLTCWPEDGGPFITLGMVFTKSPEEGRRNIGLYRLQVYDRNTTGMHWHPPKGGAAHYLEAEKRGERLPVAVAIGADPTTLYSATAPVPDGIDELLFSGFIRRKPVEMVKCKTLDLEVPAESQIVLEGYVEPGERRVEGPFGDHTGYYSLSEEFPVFHVTCITMKKNPVYAATIVGPPPMEDAWLGKATERIFLPLLKMIVPEVVDYNLPVEGGFHNLAIVSIKKRFAGHARKVMNALWGLGQMMVSKCIIIVDDDVDVHNYQEVAWKVMASIDPERDMQFTMGPVDILDHASREFGFGSKVGIDATKKWKDEGFTRRWPEIQLMTESVKKRVDELWPGLGIHLKK
jgi:4-hydroxy-3-polyprenylbenzoate decarboxylase